MTRDDIDVVCRLIADAMNEDEARWARRTFDFHFACASHGLDDGREYVIFNVAGRAAGIIGLHHYAWGPDENVWLAWFAVHPELQRRGIGRHMLTYVEERAVEWGYRKIFVETYDHPDFEKAVAFYTSCGFERVGTVENYLPDAGSMIVYAKALR